jgi:hypothetical protein
VEINEQLFVAMLTLYDFIGCPASNQKIKPEDLPIEDSSVQPEHVMK